MLSGFGLDLSALEYLQNQNKINYSKPDLKKVEKARQEAFSFIKQIHNLQKPREKSLSQKEIDNLSN